MAMNPGIQTTGRDRRLYIWLAVFMPIIVLAGFARSYYLKGFFGFPALPSLLVHLHGVVMTSWVGTSMVIVRRLTRTIRSIGQNTQIKPGPFGSAISRPIALRGSPPPCAVAGAAGEGAAAGAFEAASTSSLVWPANAISKSCIAAEPFMANAVA